MARTSASGYMKDNMGRRLDEIPVPDRTELGIHETARKSAAPAENVPAVLDINYESRMSLYGFETYTRAATDTYTDALGVSQTAAINTPGFDRQARVGTGWLLPVGLKCNGSGLAAFNASAILPTSNEYTIVIDFDRPTSYSGSGTIFTMHSGAATHRIEINVNSNYQPQALVQASGTVHFNVALGPTQGWYGGVRRLVLVVKAGAFVFADSGKQHNAQASGSAPAKANLTNAQLGGSTVSSGYAVGWLRRVQILPVALTTAQAVTLSGGTNPVATWGDSLTDGTGASGPSGIYPEVLRMSRWPASGVYEGGVGGETSTQIKDRMVADTIRRDWTTVIWAGRNNFANGATVLADIETMVNSLSHKRFVILSIVNKADGTENTGSTAHTQITALNAALAAKYPANYIDIRSQIVAASAGTGDAPNASWTADGLHLNNTGYTYVAGKVSDFLRTSGWY